MITPQLYFSIIKNLFRWLVLRFFIWQQVSKSMDTISLLGKLNNHEIGLKQLHSVMS